MTFPFFRLPPDFKRRVFQTASAIAKREYHESLDRWLATRKACRRFNASWIYDHIRTPDKFFYVHRGIANDGGVKIIFALLIRDIDDTLKMPCDVSLVMLRHSARKLGYITDGETRKPGEPPEWVSRLESEIVNKKRRLKM